MKKLFLFALTAAMLVLMLAFTVSAECTAEHDGKWTVTFGDKGYLGEITASYSCATCGNAVTETIAPLFETLGYSYGESGIIQHYAANRVSIARYEELTGEKIKFGAVAATTNNVSSNPLDANGQPVNEKVAVVDFTDTEYDIFDIMVNNIPDRYKGEVGIICCAYIIAGNEITYIENGAEKVNSVANTYERVTEKVDNAEEEPVEINSYTIIDGTKYRKLSVEELGLTQWAYWYSSSGTGWNDIFTGTSGTPLKYFATRKFTRDELPNGTIITVSNKWYYRPEGWLNNQKSDGVNGRPSRPGEVRTETVVVDDAWWGVFDTRAFNITKGSNIASTVTENDIYAIFSIQVPVSSGTVDVIPPSEGGDVVEPEAPETSGTEAPVNPNPDPEPDTPEGGDEPVQVEKQNWQDDGALKILCIGNSFSVDSMEYVYQVAQAAGVKNIVLGNLYIGGCSLATHLSNLQGNKGAYTYYTNNNGSWKSTGSKSIKYAVESDDWDFISIQQVSGYSGVADSYNDLDAILDIVEPMNPSARLVWHMTWAYKANSGHADFSKYDKNQMTMYNAIINAVQTKVLTDDRIEIVIPAGTSIQNARTSYYGDNFTRDGYHLNDFGRFIGSLTFVKALTGLSIDNITYKLDSMTGNNLLLAIDAVNKAVAAPFAITTSAYAKEPEVEAPEVPEGGGIPEGYRQLTLEEMGWQSCSYWNGKTFSYDTSKDFNKSYYATTKSFTIKEIPIGSIIVLKQGEKWQYRPDGWGGSGSRPGNVTAEIVYVNEGWWQGYTTRGFNVSKTSASKIDTYTPEQIYEVLKIYVPDNSAAGTVESSVTSDMCVDTVTVIDGKEYRALTAEAMGLTPLSYYWSEKGTGLYLDDAEMAKKFFATAEFGKTVLVNGSVIWVASGWQYRPEGWSYTGSRPDNVSTEYVTVDGTWWGSYSVRAFNISMQNLPVLSTKGYETVEQVYEMFKIYIPVELIAD